MKTVVKQILRIFTAGPQGYNVLVDCLVYKTKRKRVNTTLLLLFILLLRSGLKRLKNKDLVGGATANRPVKEQNPKPFRCVATLLCSRSGFH